MRETRGRIITVIVIRSAVESVNVKDSSQQRWLISMRLRKMKWEKRRLSSSMSVSFSGDPDTASAGRTVAVRRHSNFWSRPPTITWRGSDSVQAGVAILMTSSPGVTSWDCGSWCGRRARMYPTTSVSSTFTRHTNTTEKRWSGYATGRDITNSGCIFPGYRLKVKAE